ncbi:GMC family oxidoreductase [Pendulispora albinea]|uniref:GMC family oxidoreductase N-terminal domain-containing protein n=1 Tax=Pendulispora albinea TaxID=2741071 RepID=A0ABZ2M6V1_9BACT
MPKLESFDYIVVGAGSAGCVLAHRLSEDPSVTVLLLEAGEPAAVDEAKIPAAFSSLFKTRWDWNYETAPQEHLGGKRAFWPRMKALGGCSAMNAMIYIRGHRADYDAWRDEFGAKGWGYDDVLPTFVRMEHNTRFGAPYHGRGGPVHVEDRRFTHELTHAWVRAAVASGLPANPDFNGAEQLGAGLYQVTCKEGRRCSTADAYLAPALRRPNLTVRTGALATRIVLQGLRAIGVDYVQNGAPLRAHANLEVVLAGGAINSPQLLMLSGIGPAAHLGDMGIEVAVDLPGVGENLHDHPVTPMLWWTKGTTDIAVDHVNLPRVLQWQLAGRGPLTSNIGEGGAFFSTRSGQDAPNIQIIVAPTGFYDHGLREARGRMFTAGVTLIDVASRGRLRLRSADPRWRPALDPAYFSEPADREAVLLGFRKVAEIARAPEVARFLDRPFIPERLDGISDDAARDHIRKWTQTLYHPVGTCRMGTGAMAVVDPELRVRGVAGLRVADASIMPKIVRGNTNAPAILIGEKAADLLLGRTTAIAVPERAGRAAASPRTHEEKYA